MSSDAKIITGITILAVAVIGILIYLAGKNPTSDRYLPQSVNQAVQAGDSRYAVGGLVNEGDPSDGATDARVTLVEFADFECPVCRTVFPTIMALRGQFTDQELRLVYRHAPLWEIHAEALASARASQAAHSQGKFNEYAQALYDNQSRLGEDLYLEIAKQVGLDLDRFNADRASDATAWQAARGRDYMTAQGWDLATPTILINGQLYQGERSDAALAAAIRAAR